MKERNVLNFEEALDFVKEKYENSVDFPLLVGVYGNPNNGKTHFVKEFMKRNFSWEAPYAVRTVNDMGEFYNLSRKDDVRLLFVQVSSMMEASKYITNWNFKREFGKKGDLSILLFNPSIEINSNLDRLSKNYELVCLNPKSEIKRI
ncbi:MAG: hypothetical protein NUV46_03465 [Nanoarchaeota archaeon]|nr:hypothetical protein [Nanoarchaeota archaeon]